MRKTGILTEAYFKETGYEEGFAKMRAHGFETADYSDICNVDTAFFGAPDAEFDRKMLDVKRAADNAGVEIYQTHGPWICPPRNDTPEARAIWLSQCEKAMRGTALLGSKVFVIHPLMPFGTDAEPDSTAYREINAEFFRKLVGKAREYDLVICLENMPFRKQSIHTAAQVKAFVDEIADKRLKICLDTGHANIAKCNPAEDVRLCKNSIRAFHVHDNNSWMDLHTCPFFGTIDWADFSAAVRENIDESVPLMLETGYKEKFPGEFRDRYHIGLAEIARYLADGGKQA